MSGFVARWLPGLAPGLGALLNPWVLLALVAFGTGCFTAGWKVESWRWDASLKDIAEQNTRFLQAYARRQGAINAGISTRLERERLRRVADRRKFQEDLANARSASLVEVDCPQPRPAGDPAPALAGGAEAGPVRLSAVAVGLWNDGLAQGLPAAYGAWRADADARGAGAVDLRAALGNHGDNAAICNALRARLLGWQQWARENGLTP